MYDSNAACVSSEASGSADAFPLGDEFFAPANTDMIDTLVGEYRQRRELIARFAAVVESELGGAIPYFLDGNRAFEGYRYSARQELEKMFDPAGAVAALNAAYWQKTLDLTDVFDYMPQKRRSEWHEQIAGMTTPEFAEATVRSTLQSLLAMRGQFLAEKVDGLFQALSGAHVTNRPEGFGKRMIVGAVLSEYGYTDSGRVGYLTDLRSVVNRLLGRGGDVDWRSTDAMVGHCKAVRGEWVDIDGGALRMRVYKKGTAHLEVHPEVAWQLNRILAMLHPAAIPPQFRRRPARSARAFRLIDQILAPAVAAVLAEWRQASEPIPDDIRGRRQVITNAIELDGAYRVDKAIWAQVQRVMEALGGVPISGRRFQFDYWPGEVIGQVVASRCIPEQQSHQFYGTGEDLAQVAVEAAGIEAGDRCLEPNAGQGGLLRFLPVDTTAVEVSALHCRILREKGFANVIEADFLAWAEREVAAGLRYDRIVMNPPFSDGRWQRHIEAAASLLAAGGRLVAIVPASARGKAVLPGLTCTWSSVIENAFPGTSVAVVILTAERA